MEKLCHYCGKIGDLRPYGPGGTQIHFACMKADPKREAEATRQFAGRIFRAGPMVVLGGEDGPEAMPGYEG